MKLLLTVLIFGIVQLCFTAVINIDDDSFTSSDIEEFRSQMAKIPGVDLKSIDKFTTILECFSKNSTETESWDAMVKLMAIAMDIDYLKLNETFTEIDNSGENKATDNNQLTSGESDSSEMINLKEIETSLLKRLTKPQTEFVMEIFRVMGNNATSEETESAMVNLVTNAMIRTIIPSGFNETNTI